MDNKIILLLVVAAIITISGCSTILTGADMNIYVTDGNGNPVGGATVNAYTAYTFSNSGGDKWVGITGTIQASRTTNALGYANMQLQPGNYAFQVSKENAYGGTEQQIATGINAMNITITAPATGGAGGGAGGGGVVLAKYGFLEVNGVLSKIGGVNACPASSRTAPVCGVDLENYAGDCDANALGVKVRCSGECPCDTGCDYASGMHYSFNGENGTSRIGLNGTAAGFMLNGIRVGKFGPLKIWETSDLEDGNTAKLLSITITGPGPNDGNFSYTVLPNRCFPPVCMGEPITDCGTMFDTYEECSAFGNRGGKCSWGMVYGGCTGAPIGCESETNREDCEAYPQNDEGLGGVCSWTNTCPEGGDDCDGDNTGYCSPESCGDGTPTSPCRSDVPGCFDLGQKAMCTGTPACEAQKSLEACGEIPGCKPYQNIRTPKYECNNGCLITTLDTWQCVPYGYSDNTSGTYCEQSTGEMELKKINGGTCFSNSECQSSICSPYNECISLAEWNALGSTGTGAKLWTDFSEMASLPGKFTADLNSTSIDSSGFKVLKFIATPNTTYLIKANVTEVLGESTADFDGNLWFTDSDSILYPTRAYTAEWLNPIAGLSPSQIAALKPIFSIDSNRGKGKGYRVNDLLIADTNSYFDRDIALSVSAVDGNGGILAFSLYSGSNATLSNINNFDYYNRNKRSFRLMPVLLASGNRVDLSRAADWRNFINRQIFCRAPPGSPRYDGTVVNGEEGFLINYYGPPSEFDPVAFCSGTATVSSGNLDFARRLFSESIDVTPPSNTLCIDLDDNGSINQDEECFPDPDTYLNQNFTQTCTVVITNVNHPDSVSGDKLFSMTVDFSYLGDCTGKFVFNDSGIARCEQLGRDKDGEYYCTPADSTVTGRTVRGFIPSRATDPMKSGSFSIDGFWIPSSWVNTEYMHLLGQDRSGVYSGDTEGLWVSVIGDRNDTVFKDLLLAGRWDNDPHFGTFSQIADGTLPAVLAGIWTSIDLPGPGPIEVGADTEEIFNILKQPHGIKELAESSKTAAEFKTAQELHNSLLTAIDDLQDKIALTEDDVLLDKLMAEKKVLASRLPASFKKLDELAKKFRPLLDRAIWTIKQATAMAKLKFTPSQQQIFDRLLGVMGLRGMSKLNAISIPFIPVDIYQGNYFSAAWATVGVYAARTPATAGIYTAISLPCILENITGAARQSWADQMALEYKARYDGIISDTRLSQSQKEARIAGMINLDTFHQYNVNNAVDTLIVPYNTCLQPIP